MNSNKKIAGMVLVVFSLLLGFASAESFNTQGNAGITTVDGTTFWVVNMDAPGKVYKIDANGDTLATYDVSSLAVPYGITTVNGNEFWITGWDTGMVYHTDDAFELIDSFSVKTLVPNPQGIATLDGTTFWIKKYKVDESGALLSTLNTTLDIVGIDAYGSYLWVTDGSSKIYRLDSDGTVSGTFDANAYCSQASDVATTNGRDFWVMDYGSGTVTHLSPDEIKIASVARKRAMSMSVEGGCVGEPITVKTYDGDEALSVFIAVTLEGKTVYEANTVDGMVKLVPMKVGTYTITAEKARYNSEEKAITIKDCEGKETTTVETTTSVEETTTTVEVATTVQTTIETTVPTTVPTTIPTTVSTTIKETCDDGIINQGEEGVDCGGPCAACPGIVGRAVSSAARDASGAVALILILVLVMKGIESKSKKEG